MRALVTGGCGFIGGHIVDALLASDHDALVLDALDTRVHSGVVTLPPSVELLKADVRTLTRIPDVDVIFHEAAMVGLGKGPEDAEDYSSVNVLGTIRLIRAAAALPRPPRIVLASTMALYGEGAYKCPSCAASPGAARRREKDLSEGRWDPACASCGADLRPVAVTEAHPARPETLYAISKLDQELTAMALGRALGVPIVALRYHNVYGPRMPRDTPYAGVASFFISRLLAGEPPLVHEDGAQLRDFVRVEDVARANLLAAVAKGVEFEAFNIGTGQPRSVMDLAQALSHELAPHLTPRLSGRYRPGDARHVFASIEKARSALGYRPQIAFDEGVRRFAHEPVRAAGVNS